NVMLTRARKGMVIVTSLGFIQSDGGARTLVGKLSQYWENRGINAWIDWRRVADGTAVLPGSPGTPAPSLAAEQSELRLSPPQRPR
ncbi:hypothetical protein B0H15DRAFT_748033, partial [Mycena belliarum]